MTLPLACNLDGTSAKAQGDAWRALLARVLDDYRWDSPTSVAMHLQVDVEELDAVVRLAQSETACCPFFRFSLHIEASDLSLVVSVDEEAAPLLESFFESIAGAP